MQSYDPLDSTKQQISFWIKKTKRNIVLYKHGRGSLSQEERLNLLRNQYNMLELIVQALEGKGRFVGFEQKIPEVTINDLKEFR